jgi:adenylosuccinate synthase
MSKAIESLNKSIQSVIKDVVTSEIDRFAKEIRECCEHSVDVKKRLFVARMLELTEDYHKPDGEKYLKKYL